MINSLSDNLLGLDYGLKHIGVAVAVAGLPQPLTTLTNDQYLISHILDLVTDYKISKVVIGLSDGSMLTSSKQFGESLQKQLVIPVVYIDETLSSVEAGERISWQKTFKRRQQPLHEIAAAIILETYLDQLASTE